MLNGKSLRRKKKHYYQILNIQYQRGAKFQLQQTVLNFWTKSIWKKCSQSKKKKQTNKQINKKITIQFSIFKYYIHILQMISFKFQLLQIILIFWEENSKKDTSGLNRKKKQHHYWIVHILVSLSIKRWFKLINLFFFCPKRVFCVSRK